MVNNSMKNNIYDCFQKFKKLLRKNENFSIGVNHLKTDKFYVTIFLGFLDI